MKSKNRRPIGVFDSGLGGLTLLREIREKLPAESILYFGDLARLPYGIKSREQIIRFSTQNTLFLLKHRVKAMVIACNSSSSTAYPFLKSHFRLPIVDVVRPAVREAAEKTRIGRIGVLSTQATMDSRVYERELQRIRKSMKVFPIACPLFVPFVEEGWLNGRLTLQVAETYLKPLKKQKVDVLILGCTHYPLLKPVLRRVVGKNVVLVDSIRPTVRDLALLLGQKGLSYPGLRKGDFKIYVSDKPRNFLRVGERFLGEKFNHVEVVRPK